MKKMGNDESEHEQSADDHVTRSVAGLDVIPFFVAVRAGAPVIEGEADSKINVEGNRNQQGNPDGPEERAEITQMLRVIIDPARSQKNLQVAQQMSNDEQQENHAGERDDHFLADGGAIKAGEVSHAEIRLAFLFSRSITISGQHVCWAHRLTACVPCRERAGEHRLAASVPLPAWRLVS